MPIPTATLFASLTAAAPTLIVNDLKTGAQAKGGVALSLDVETIAHFRNLTVRLEPDETKSPLGG